MRLHGKPDGSHPFHGEILPALLFCGQEMQLAGPS